MASSSKQLQIQENSRARSVYKTKSVCSRCFDLIEGELVEDCGKIFLEKGCPVCGFGEKCLVENDASFFKRTVGLFPPEADPIKASVQDLGRLSSHAIGFFLTPRCNGKCSVCIAKDYICEASITRKKQLTVDEVRSVIGRASLKGKEILLVGGEPTVHKDFFEIVGLFRKSGNPVVLYTNGKRLVNKAFVRKMKSSGVSLVDLSFDSLDDSVYSKMKGEPLLKKKLSALNNLLEAGLPTCLVSTIANGVNDGEIARILRFAAERGASRVMFHPMRPYGKVEIKHGWLFTSSDILKRIESQTNGQIRVRDFENLLRARKLAFDCVEKVFGNGAAKKFSWGRGYSIILRRGKNGTLEPLFSEEFLSTISKKMEGFLSGRSGMDSLTGMLSVLLAKENREIFAALVGSGFDRIGGIYRALGRKDLLQLHVADISTQHNVDFSRQVDVYEYSKTPEGRELVTHMYPA